MNIVLAHGFFGFRAFLNIEYFLGVAEHLRAKFTNPPIKVFAPVVDPIGRVAKRGTQLASRIDEALRDGGLDPALPIHIIAHSMGGLDARFCISSGCNPEVANRILSLTTIATPHRGSPIADLLTVGGVIDQIKRPLLFANRRLADLINAVDLNTGGILDLTSAAARAFNRDYTNIDTKHYFSYAGRGRNQGAPTCLTLRVPHALIAQENDGLVSVESATWGQLLEVWPADHADEIGHDLDRGFSAPSTALNHLEKYESIVAMLAACELADSVNASQN